MFSIEPFVSGSRKKIRVSKAEIEEIKKNMQKVPRIQKKAEQLQLKEGKKADESLQNQVKQLQSKEPEKEEDPQTQWWGQSLKRRQQVLQWIREKRA